MHRLLMPSQRQVFTHSLLLTRLLVLIYTRLIGTVALAPSDIGAFSKSSFLPLILTDPYAASIKERLKIENIMIEEANGT